jgi:5-methylcytosine-specific restriction endonuclease McrA
MARKAIPFSVQQQVLIEAGYRCGVPTCRNILAIDLHHLVPVNENGQNDIANLLALCPTCHALYHRGTYTKEAVYAWKQGYSWC